MVWKPASTIVSLGHSLTSNGDFSQDRRRLKRSWEATFWRNSRVLTCSRIDLRSRLRFWKTLSKGIGNYRFSMWPPQCATCRQVEGWHNAILQRIIHVPFCADQTAEEFCRNRNRVVAAERDNAGLSVRSAWADSLTRWLEHMQRHPDTTCAIVYAAHDELLLDTIQCLSGGGCTNTRNMVM